MKWTEEKLKRLQEINSMRKNPRYFGIKTMVENFMSERKTNECEACEDPTRIGHTCA